MIDKYDFEMRLNEIIEFWYGDIKDDTFLEKSDPHIVIWQGKDSQVDVQIKNRFTKLWNNVVDYVCTGWEPKEFEQNLATILIFDQLPRNMYRDTPLMYHTDELALTISKNFLQDNYIWDKDLFKIMFFCMPLMHSEKIEDQVEMLKYFNKIYETSVAKKSPNEEFFKMSLSYALRHKEIVEKFGRFPHRNKILNRKSTKEEESFLLTPNSSF